VYKFLLKKFTKITRGKIYIYRRYMQLMQNANEFTAEQNK